MRERGRSMTSLPIKVKKRLPERKRKKHSENRKSHSEMKQVHAHIVNCCKGQWSPTDTWS